MEIKVTLNATSLYCENKHGEIEHHVNQYVLKQEIGHGSFGAVHMAVDQDGNEYAIKKLSKTRLRRNSQTSIFKKLQHDRKCPGPTPVPDEAELPYTAHYIHKTQALQDPLYLIKGEIEAMKRLNHPNVVRLYEVLDDPEDESWYMVLEICKAGVTLKVDIGERADPKPTETCRMLFRQIISGIRHIHEQGVVHGDIKPDNLLLTEEGVVKIIDFGVSELFDKGSDMKVCKSVGSPAFTPPELCVVNHGSVCGRAADIWSIGISIYCLRFGCLPFEGEGLIEIYQAIRDEVLKIELSPDQEPEFQDLITQLLNKDPNRRISMDEINVHPWVTKNGTDPLPSPNKCISRNPISTKTKGISTNGQLSEPATTVQDLNNEVGRDSRILFEHISLGTTPNFVDHIMKISIPESPHISNQIFSGKAQSLCN